MADIGKTLGVLVVDDSVAFTDHIAALIATLPGFELRGVAHSKQEARELFERIQADVYLVDLGLPDGDGTELIHCLHNLRPVADIVVVTVFADDAHVVESIRLGATGYLLKDANSDDLSYGLRTIQEGGSPISPTIARRILALWQPPTPSEMPAKPLSPREMDTLVLISKGCSLEEVARILGLSRATVATYVRGIYRKLEVNTRSEAVLEAARCGLLKVN